MKTLTFLLVLTFLLIGCKQSLKKITEVEFNVNKTLLSDSLFVSNTGFTIYPPKNWVKTESYNSELQKKILNRIDNKLLAIYKSDTTNCALIISEIPETNFDIIKGLLNKSKPFPKQDSLWTKVQSSIFKYKSFEIIQIVSQNSELIIFKLVTRRLSESFELDYIIPRNEINTNMQSVESSIGSLN